MLVSGYNWTYIDHVGRHGAHGTDSERCERPGGLMACDVAARSTPTYGDQATFNPSDESFYPWPPCSVVSSCLSDPCDGYTQSMTSLGVLDTMATNYVSRCDLPGDKVLPTSPLYCRNSDVLQGECGGPYADVYQSDIVMPRAFESLQSVLPPTLPASSSYNRTIQQFTPSSPGSRCKLVELDVRPDMMSEQAYARPHQHHLQRFDNHPRPTAAADADDVDSPPSDFSSEFEKPQNDRERIKKKKHNLVEKRRRSNINEQMNALGSLLPKKVSMSRNKRPNKGNILRETVAYIRLLQQDQARLSVVEQRTQRLCSSIRHILSRLKELEELLRTSDCSAKVSLSEFGLVVDDLDAYIKEEPSPSSASAVDVPFTCRSADMLVTCRI